MQNIFINIKCSEIILYNANENWYIILYDLFSRLCYIATCGPFCKDVTHIYIYIYIYYVETHGKDKRVSIIVFNVKSTSKVARMMTLIHINNYFRM